MFVVSRRSHSSTRERSIRCTDRRIVVVDSRRRLLFSVVFAPHRTARRVVCDIRIIDD
jgi:hypothetical protein